VAPPLEKIPRERYFYFQTTLKARFQMVGENKNKPTCKVGIFSNGGKPKKRNHRPPIPEGGGNSISIRVKANPCKSSICRGFYNGGDDSGKAQVLPTHRPKTEDLRQFRLVRHRRGFVIRVLAILLP